MKISIAILFVSVISILSLNGQIISTFAGGSSGGDGIPATSSSLPDPGGCAFSKNGILYINSGTGNKVRKIDTFGIITTIAGNGTSGYSGDYGSATSALLNFPVGLTLDTLGNIYISDALNRVIRKIDIATGIITTICGNGTIGNSGDNGAATNAQLGSPNGICFDKFGNLYIADTHNSNIRRVNSTGIITTFAGNGIYGFSGDNGPATLAQLRDPDDVTTDDSNNLYIADLSNSRVRKVNSAGIITTYSGNGIGTFAGDGMLATNAQINPAFIKFDNNQNLYIGSFGIGNYRVYKIGNDDTIHIVAGNGNTGFSGDNGPATNAAIRPGGLAFDKCGNLYISDIDNGRIRKVALNPTCNLSVSQVETNNEVTIYPNPASEEITISGIKTNTKYSLFNIKSIIEQQGILKVGSNTLSIEALSPGLYILELTMDDGTKIRKKIIKL